MTLDDLDAFTDRLAAWAFYACVAAMVALGLYAMTLFAESL